MPPPQQPTRPMTSYTTDTNPDILILTLTVSRKLFDDAHKYGADHEVYLRDRLGELAYDAGIAAAYDDNAPAR